MNELTQSESPGGFHHSVTRRAVFGRAAGAGAAMVGAAVLSRSSAFASQSGVHMIQDAATPTASTPTVVLVHGAFADASGWAAVISSLQEAGVPAVAPANPLRSVSGDAAYIASVIEQIPGPVLLVGHSYGGMVITNAAPLAKNVIGLVYICAFIPEVGESIQDLAAQATDSLLGPALRPAQFWTGPDTEPGIELFIDTAAFHEAFCADLPAATAAAMSVSQRPGGAIGFGEKSAAAGWKELPSWALIGTADKTIGVTGLRLMAGRAGATSVEIDASHVAMISQPAATVDLIKTALASLA